MYIFHNVREFSPLFLLLGIAGQIIKIIGMFTKKVVSSKKWL